jgi:small subunit ribosomal protein S21
MRQSRHRRTEADRAAADAGDIEGGLVLDIRVEDGNIEKALKLLKRYIQKEGILKDVKRKSFYEKPSEMKRRKAREARKRRLKAERRKGRYERG